MPDVVTRAAIFFEDHVRIIRDAIASGFSRSVEGACVKLGMKIADFGVELRRDEGRPHPVQHQPIDHRAVDVALHDDPLAHVAERHAGRVVAL